MPRPGSGNRHSRTDLSSIRFRDTIEQPGMTERHLTICRCTKPVDLAAEYLAPRLRSYNHLNEPDLAASPYFRAVVDRIADSLPQAELLSKHLPPKLLRTVQQAASWYAGLLVDVTGRNLPYCEPVISRTLRGAAVGQYERPFIKVAGSRVAEVQSGTCASAFSPEAMRRLRELVATIVHELVHASRGFQLSPRSGELIRLGLKIDAFQHARPGAPTLKDADTATDNGPFDALVEAAAVLTEASLLARHARPELCSLNVCDTREDRSPGIGHWAELHNLGDPGSMFNGVSRERTIKDELFELMRSVGIPVRETVTSPRKGSAPLVQHRIALNFTSYVSPDFNTPQGYPLLHHGMEMLGMEIYRDRTPDDAAAVEMFRDELIRAEVLADPRALFREIKQLAAEDAAESPDRSHYNPIKLGKDYLRFLAFLRPDNELDMMLLHTFAYASARGPAFQAAAIRSRAIRLHEQLLSGLTKKSITDLITACGLSRACAWLIPFLNEASLETAPVAEALSAAGAFLTLFHAGLEKKMITAPAALQLLDISINTLGRRVGYDYWTGLPKKERQNFHYLCTCAMDAAHRSGNSGLERQALGRVSTLMDVYPVSTPGDAS